MAILALGQNWSDFFTIGGFAVGLVGFAVTIWQILRTKKAIIAAQEAAAETLQQSRSSFERFMAGYASRLVSELQNAVVARDWKSAKTRVEDLAELLATLQNASNSTILIVEELRVFSYIFAEKASRPNAPFDRGKYRELVNRVHSHLDRARAPFREDVHDENDPDDTSREAARNRPGPSDEDEGGGGQLGPAQSR